MTADHTWLHRGAAAALLLISAVIVWLVTGALIDAKRGLDLTDEGLYLLAADPPSSEAAWVFPWGWHTRPLFRLAGWDIAAFRTLGATLLTLAGAGLGWLAGRALAQTRGAGRDRRACAATAATGACVAALYYAPMLRTPSYNWVALFGILLAASAIVALAGRLNTRDRQPGVSGSLALAALAGLGVCVTVPAKPSIAVGLVIAGFLPLAAAAGRRRAMRWTLATVAAVAGWITVAVLTALWPVSFLSVLHRAADFPLNEGQSRSLSLTGTLEIRHVIVDSLDAAHPAWLLLAASGLVVLVTAALVRRAHPLVRLAGFALVALAGLGIAGLTETTTGVPRLATWASPGTTSACALVLVGSCLAAVPTRGGSPVARPELRLPAAVLAFLSILPFLYGLGSANGTYGQAAGAAGILLVAACVPHLGGGQPAIRMGAVALVLAFTAVLSVSALDKGRGAPYRSAAFAEQNTPTPIGARGAVLSLDAAQSRTITRLRAGAGLAGWRPGTPLVDTTWRWNPGIAYALGARVPESLLVTIFGYRTTIAWARYTTSARFPSAPYRGAWMLTSGGPGPDPAAGAEVEVTAVRSLIQRRTRRAFPNGYRRAAASGPFLLWRPSVEPSG